MKNPKTIYKYAHDSEIGYMHYIIFEDDVVVLSKEDSLKIDFINNHGYLNVTKDLKGTEFTKVNAHVVTNMEYVQKVYDFMLESNNTYFKEGTEGLCAIVIEK